MGEANMATTMKDIADMVGVSQPTVSAVLRNKSYCYVSQEKKDAIHLAARRMGYRVNAIARSMVTGKTQVLAFVSPGLTCEHECRILGGCLAQADAEGYFVKPFLENNDNDFAKTITKIIEHRVDGILMVGMTRAKHKELSSAITPYNIALASMDNSDIVEGLIQVASADAKAADAAVEHLIKLGHQRITYFSDSPTYPYVINCHKGYREAMKRHGLAEEECHIGINDDPPWNEQRAELTRTMLRRKDPPTAIFCCSDTIAAIVIQVAQELNIRVPDNLSLVGFGNWHLASFLTPALTTVKKDYEAMGRRATSRLVAQLRGNADPSPDNVELIPAELVVRKSTAPPFSHRD